MVRFAATLLVLLLACASPIPLYEKGGGTRDEFERAKAHCMEVSFKSVPYRRTPTDTLIYRETYNPTDFELCMKDYGWNRRNLDEKVTTVVDAEPYLPPH